MLHTFIQFITCLDVIVSTVISYHFSHSCTAIGPRVIVATVKLYDFHRSCHFVAAELQVSSNVNSDG